MKRLAPIFLLFAGNATYASSIRYELPSLLGEHIYDGSQTLWNAAAQVDTPFGFYAVEQATLVIEGSFSQGIARGDGVIRENTSFDLLPSVSVRPSFAQSIDISTEPTPPTFRFETKYPHPFVPETTPLPNPDGYPPVSFVVYLSIGPAFGTVYFDPSVGTQSTGIIVNVPIVAHIESAYIILNGSSIVPEPSSIALICGLAVLIANCRSSRRQQVLARNR